MAATGEPEQYDPSVALGGGDTPTVIDGKEYYIYTVSDVDIGALKIVPGKNVIIVGTNTQLRAGLQVPASEAKPAVGTLPAELPKVGSLKIFMDGDIRLTGTQSVNKVPSPNTSWAGALEVYTTTTNQLVLNGNGEFLGSIYAPRAELVGNGGGNETMDLSGSFVVGRITSNGHMQFHFDEGLGSTASAKPWILSLWTEMQTAAERNLYASKLNF